MKIVSDAQTQLFRARAAQAVSFQQGSVAGTLAICPFTPEETQAQRSS